MGLFDFLKKSDPGYQLHDWVWRSTDEKWQGLQAHLRAHPDVAVLAWSGQTRDQLEGWLEGKGLQQRIQLAGQVLPSRMQGQQVVFVEHHLFFSKEQERWAQMKPQSITVFSALSDPIFQALGNQEGLIRLMENLGLKEGEQLEHRMITKSIHRAQRRLEQLAREGKLSPVVQDWLEQVR